MDNRRQTPSVNVERAAKTHEVCLNGMLGESAARAVLKELPCCEAGGTMQGDIPKCPPRTSTLQGSKSKRQSETETKQRAGKEPCKTHKVV